MGNIQMVGKSQAPMFRGEKPGETALAPSWTLRDVARHAVDFWLSTEDLPRPENRGTLARDVAVAGERRPVLRAPQGRGREPEVDGVAGDVAQRPRRRQLGLPRLLAAEHVGLRLADHLD